MNKNNRKLYILPIKDKFNKQVFEMLLQYVSPEKAQQIETLYYSLDKKLSLYAQIAVKLIIKKEYNIGFDTISISNDKFGKPYIENLSDIFFNISHTHNVIAIAFSINSVGVDVEKKQINHKFAERFFTPKECEYIMSSADKYSKRALEIWTKKEAYVKCSGVGLKKPFNDFCVLSDWFENKFLTLQLENCIISFYDGMDNNSVEIIKLTEDEIEKLQLKY